MSDFSWLKDSVTKIENKLDKLDERMDSQNATLVEQKVILDEHQRRSLANEENLDILRKEFKPVQTHVEQVNFLFKAIGFISLLIGIVQGVLKLLDHF